MINKTKFSELISFLKKKELEEILIMGEQKRNNMFSNSILVLEAICNNYNEIVQQQFDINWIRQNCAKNQKDNQWRNTQANLADAFYHYLKNKKLADNNFEKDFELLDFFTANELHINYKRLLKNIQNSLDKQAIDFHSDYYEFRLKEHELILSEKTSTIKRFDNLEAWDIKLEQFYYINKLKIIIAKANRGYLNTNIHPEEKEYDLINQIPESFIENPTIKTMIDCYKLFVENKTEYYEKLKEMVKNDKKMSFDFRSYVFSLLFNFVINKYNSGGDEIKVEYLNLIDTMENLGMLSQHGQVSRARIKNAATVAVRMNKIDWLEKFLEKSKKKTNHKNRMAVLNYVDGLIHFHKESYHKSIKILEKIKPIDETLKVSKDILLIKSYFILNSEEAFHKRTDTLYRKMNSNKILTKRRRKLRKQFIKFTVKVFNNRGRKHQLLNIKTKIEQYGYLPEADWLIKQIDLILK